MPDLSAGMMRKTAANLPSIAINDLPVFEQNMARSASLVPGEDPTAVAHTTANDPHDTRIAVDRPKIFDKEIAAHELVHLIQNRAGAGNYVDPDQSASIYDYGGTKGLSKTKSIARLNDEQQANVPKNYMDNMTMYAAMLANPRAGKMFGGLQIPSVQNTLKEADQMNAAYARPLQQLANMANPSRDTIDTTPAAPGPPPAALTGMIKPLPQVGGSTLFSTIPRSR